MFCVIVFAHWLQPAAENICIQLLYLYNGHLFFSSFPLNPRVVHQREITLSLVSLSPFVWKNYREEKEVNLKMGEEKPKSTGVWPTVKPFVNGGVSGMLATCVIQPVDMIKVLNPYGCSHAAVQIQLMETQFNELSVINFLLKIGFLVTFFVFPWIDVRFLAWFQILDQIGFPILNLKD